MFRTFSRLFVTVNVSQLGETAVQRDESAMTCCRFIHLSCCWEPTEHLEHTSALCCCRWHSWTLQHSQKTRERSPHCTASVRTKLLQRFHPENRGGSQEPEGGREENKRLGNLSLLALLGTLPVVDWSDWHKSWRHRRFYSWAAPWLKTGADPLQEQRLAVKHLF